MIIVGVSLLSLIVSLLVLIGSVVALRYAHGVCRESKRLALLSRSYAARAEKALESMERRLAGA